MAVAVRWGDFIGTRHAAELKLLHISSCTVSRPLQDSVIAVVRCVATPTVAVKAVGREKLGGGTVIAFTGETHGLICRHEPFDLISCCFWKLELGGCNIRSSSAILEREELMELFVAIGRTSPEWAPAEDSFRIGTTSCIECGRTACRLCRSM